MSKRYLLTTRAVIDGAIRDPGYIFTLKDGEVGPCRTVGMNSPGARDEKLYEDAPDLPKPEPEAKQEPIKPRYNNDQSPASLGATEPPPSTPDPVQTELLPVDPAPPLAEPKPKVDEYTGQPEGKT